MLFLFIKVCILSQIYMSTVSFGIFHLFPVTAPREGRPSMFMMMLLHLKLQTILKSDKEFSKDLISQITILPSIPEVQNLLMADLVPVWMVI